ncbi:MAG TPA: hypothetical protein VNZ49_10865 [Bacteroidia bacterium]|jgi:hypothetical protein|nr:hypothetical protein [Bacteroidia bacterium]
MISAQILEGITKAVQKLINQKAKLNEELVFVDKDGKPYRVKATDLKK